MVDMKQRTPQDYLLISQRRLRRLQQRLKQASAVLTRWRIACFFITLVLAALALEWVSPALSLGTGLLGLFVFGGLVKRHQRIRLQQRQCDRALDLKQAHAARLELNWEQMPAVPLQEPVPDHPYETDLDITGPRSLYRLLHTCLTAEGGQRLKQWLLKTEPISPSAMVSRQAQVAALRPFVAWRDRLHLHLAEAASSYRQAQEEAPWQSQRILQHLAHLEKHRSGWVLEILVFNAFITALLYALAQWISWPALYWQLSLGVYVVTYWSHRHHVGRLFSESQGLQFEFHRLAAVFAQLERFPLDRHPSLTHLFEPFATAEKPSQLLGRLGRIVAAASLQGNPLLWAMINLVMPWDMFFAWRFGVLKPALRERLPHCLEALWELEALGCLAHYAWGHPQAVFPEPASEGLAVQGVGHPLLPPLSAQGQPKVRNDFSLKQTGDGFLITGSNMAGKSTFLKSLGLNVVLAQMGSVVDATAMQWGRVRLMTCIRVADSVSDGFSYFYAEVRRLRAILDALSSASTEASEAATVPVFYLVDEIFKGTNNRERLMGSQAYLQALAGASALGGVSTHDLELVQIAETYPQWRNYHFREFIEGGKMVFDYQLRSGPCPTTNALRIMALEGLPVPELSPE